MGDMPAYYSNLDLLCKSAHAVLLPTQKTISYVSHNFLSLPQGYKYFSDVRVSSNIWCILQAKATASGGGGGSSYPDSGGSAAAQGAGAIDAEATTIQLDQALDFDFGDDDGDDAGKGDDDDGEDWAAWGLDDPGDTDAVPATPKTDLLASAYKTILIYYTFLMFEISAQEGEGGEGAWRYGSDRDTHRDTQTRAHT